MGKALSHLRANVVAYLALFIALGGTSAYAVDKIGSSDIAKNAISSKHVKDNSLSGKDIRESTLEGLPPGPRGPQGEAGPPGPATGTAGGDLEGTFPSPTIRSGAVGPDKLGSYPNAFVFSNTPVTVPDQTDTTVPFDAEGSDTGNMHDAASTAPCSTISGSVSGNCALVAPRDGVYAVSASLWWESSSDGYRQARISSNSDDGSGLVAADVVTASNFTAIHSLFQSLSGITRLNAGDAITLNVFADVSAPSTELFSPGANGSPKAPRLNISWVAP